MAIQAPVAPLRGVTIVEAVNPLAPRALRLASNMCGRIALDLGAKVILLAPSNLNEDEPGAEIFLNSGKTRLELKSGDLVEGLTLIDEAVDCVITDVKSHETFSARSPLPASIALAMSVDDPLGGSEFTLEAQSGLLDIVGDPARQPLRIAGHQIPFAAGLACYLGVADILADARAGIATPVRRVDLLDIAVWLNWKAIGAASFDLAVPTREGADGPWTVAPCKDGFVAVVYRSVDWKTITTVLGNEQLKDPEFATEDGRQARRSELNALLRQSFSKFTRAEIREISLKYRLPLGPVFSLAELTKDAHMQARNFFYPARTSSGEKQAPSLPVKWSEHTFAPNYTTSASYETSAGNTQGSQTVSGSSSETKKQSEKKSGKPFSNCRVLDLGIITAGAGTSAILADLGADVIKIEGASYQDPFRRWDGAVPENSEPDVPPYFRMTNRGKRNLVLDLKSPEARAQLLEMVKTSDIVVENFRRGVLDNLGLGFDVLKSVNPNIILASISSQGENGPDANYVSFGTTLEAMAGLSSVTGYAGGDPVVTGREVNYPDQVVAIFASSMVETAWLAVQQGSEGVHLDLSQRELTTFLCGDVMLGSGERRGNSQPGISIQDCFKTADNVWIAVTIIEQDLSKLAQKNCGKSQIEIEQWIAQRNADEVLSALTNLEIPAKRVLDGSGVLAQRSISWAKGLMQDKEGLLVKGLLFDSGKRPASIDRSAAKPGALSREILNEFTGLEGHALDALLVNVGADL